MNKELNYAIGNLLSGNLSSKELEHQEALLLSELRCNQVPEKMVEIINALFKSGTALVLPTLLGITKNEDRDIFRTCPEYGRRYQRKGKKVVFYQTNILQLNNGSRSGWAAKTCF